MIAVDALRADHIRAYGHDRRTMRVLTDLMREEGATFAHAWSTGPGVVPAHVSLLTGCDPHVARQPQESEDSRTPLFNWFVPDGVPRLAQEFLAHGWITGAFVDHPSIAGLRGYRRGFRDYEDAGGDEQRFGFEGVATRFVSWLEEREVGEPWFGYVHMNDLERMWLSAVDEEGVGAGPVEEFTARDGAERIPPAGAFDPIFFAVPRSRLAGGTVTLGEYEARYDSALQRLDRSLARLFGRLEVIGRLEHTTIILVGTFGFGFGEAGLLLDAGALAPCDLRVPLWIRPAPALHDLPRSRVMDTVSILDVAPTALDLAGIELPSGMHGVSLKPVLLEGARHGREHAFASFAAYEGFAVAEGSYLLEVSSPAGRPGYLASSWTGAGEQEGEQEVLRDADTEVPLGQLDRGVVDTERTARLRAAGEDWMESMESLQRILHLGPLGLYQPMPGEVEDLQERGLLGDSAPARAGDLTR